MTYSRKHDLTPQRKEELTAQLKSLLNGKAFKPHAAMELVDLGADPGVWDDQGQTLLHLLSCGNKNAHYNKFMEKLVKQHGVPIDIKNRDGLTPLQYVMDCGFNIAQLEAVLRLGPNVNLLNSRGGSLLHILSKCNRKYNESTNEKSNYDRIITDLVKKYGANVDIQNQEGFTPLQARKGKKFCPDTAMLLVRLGANPNQLDSEGNSLLHRLVKDNKDTDFGYKYDPLIKELVNKRKADIDIENQGGLTPYQFLISGPFQFPQVKLLFDLGANPNELNSKKKSLREMVMKSPHHGGGNILKLAKKYSSSGRLFSQVRKKHKKLKNDECSLLNFNL